MYVKWHIKPAAGIKNLHADEALRLAGENPDYHIKDFYDAIESGDFPTYNVHLQIMDPKQAEASGINIFDVRKPRVQIVQVKSHQMAFRLSPVLLLPLYKKHAN